MKTTGIYKEVDGKLRHVQVPMAEAIELYKDNPQAVYPETFFGKMRKLRGWQNEVGERIHKTWGVNSMIDFGCASGYYLEGLYNHGATVKGFEYAYDSIQKFIPDEMRQFIHYGDVQENLVDEKFDMSFSIEVAEHILPEKSQVFVDNLSDSSTHYILFSAAKPGEAGTGHINLRPFQEWVDMFNENGFELSDSDTKEIRNIFSTLNVRSKYTRFLQRKVSFFKRGQ